MKNTSQWRELRSRLNLPESALQYLESLPPEQAGLLSQAILQADDRQRSHVNSAVEHAVRYVPAVLRSVVRKLLMD